MEIARLEVSMQRHIDRMQETAKVNCVQYGRNKKPKPKPRKFQQPTANGSFGGSSGNPSKSSRKGKKVSLPTGIYWRCSKGRHQKGQLCKALEGVCKNFSIIGHFEKVCMKWKHSTHLMNVPEASNSSTGEPDYYNEHGDPIYAHMVSVSDKHKHLIQFPINTSLVKARNLMASSQCPTVLLKADTSADVNLMNSKTFDCSREKKSNLLHWGWRHMETIVQWK